MTQTFITRTGPIAAPATTSVRLFTTSGVVVVTAFFGYAATDLERTAPVGNTPAGLAVAFTPTVGSPATLLSVDAPDPEVAAGALLLSTNSGSGGLPTARILSPGDVDVSPDGTYPPTGDIEWQVNWYPLTPGAAITAA